jgi:hypothetical protein
MLLGDEEPLIEPDSKELLGGLWFEVHCGRLETWVEAGERRWRATAIGEVYYGAEDMLASKARGGNVLEAARKRVAHA